MPDTPSPLADLLLTRRDLLRRSGMGFAALGLAGLLPSSQLARGSPALSPLAPKEAALSRQGQARHPPVHERRPVARRYLRSQAVAGRSTPASRCRARTCAPNARPAPRFRRRSSSEARPERHRGQRAVPARRPSMRRHLRHPLDARRRAESRAVADADELRRGPADPAEHGLVGDLRPRQREPEPARLHRHVSRRLSDPGNAELAVGVPARRLPGHLHRHAATPTSRS